ncbi:hypothetical protein [Actinomadura opuntiae]|uniref:hypothetical protein n=1 Tax=Actinomadura sp. OS1-43 TaxID=604315 RepID=UPI00255B1B20|nr:hypothetical protein [Actinomadura sp. OS1-43]MDL4815449.1 hypothetical protein [Actinomadura sp. OS1-43]
MPSPYRLLRATLSWLLTAARLQVIAEGHWPAHMPEPPAPETAPEPPPEPDRAKVTLPPGHPEGWSGHPPTETESRLWDQITNQGRGR